MELFKKFDNFNTIPIKLEKNVNFIDSGQNCYFFFCLTNAKRDLDT